jgi:hypothetical protein
VVKRSRRVLLVLLSVPLVAQRSDPSAILQRALQLADLYNWAAAAPLFENAEKLFAASGDKRNEFRAKLGRIRSDIERQQKKLPAVSAELREELDDNPLLQNDKELRMFCLIVKGDIDGEADTAAMKRDWEEVQTLARDLNNAKWQYRALGQLGVAAFYEGDSKERVRTWKPP